MSALQKFLVCILDCRATISRFVLFDLLSQLYVSQGDLGVQFGGHLVALFAVTGVFVFFLSRQSSDFSAVVVIVVISAQLGALIWVRRDVTRQ